MRAVIQRVKQAEVKVNGKVAGSISEGMLILLGIVDDDNEKDIEWLAGKISRLRIFVDAEGVMNLSVNDVGGQVLVVSQFTLHASTKKGNRPSYIKAAAPEKAIPLYESFKEKISCFTGKKAESGEFGALMDVSLLNSGPVTIIIDTKNRE
jgi:D-aminoacyl-tRNA deacylase